MNVFDNLNQNYNGASNTNVDSQGFRGAGNKIPKGCLLYTSRGAARKLLSDQGDWDQFNQYEPLYREQEQLVWARSQRQFTSTRTQTIYSNRGGSGTWGIGNGLGLQ